jgi:hypothetical protein
MNRITILCVLCAFARGVTGQPIITDRPDQTESAFIVPAGRLQTEVGVIFERHSFDGKESVHTVAIPLVLLRYAIHPNAELRAELEYLRVRHKSSTGDLIEHGLAPLTFGTKLRIFKEKGFRPETAFILHLTIPGTGAKNFPTDYTAPSFRFTMLNTLGDRFALSYNIGEEWDGFSGKPTGTYTGSLGFSASERIGLFIETYGFITSGERPDHRLDGGATYLIAPNIQADVSAGIGITKVSPNFFVGGGLSFRIPR